MVLTDFSDGVVPYRVVIAGGRCEMCSILCGIGVLGRGAERMAYGSAWILFDSL